MVILFALLRDGFIVADHLKFSTGKLAPVAVVFDVVLSVSYLIGYLYWGQEKLSYPQTVGAGLAVVSVVLLSLD